MVPGLEFERTEDAIAWLRSHHMNDIWPTPTTRRITDRSIIQARACVPVTDCT
jgi:hypothetical protein